MMIIFNSLSLGFWSSRSTLLPAKYTRGRISDPFAEGRAGDCLPRLSAETQKVAAHENLLVAETYRCWRHLEMHWLQTVHSNLSSYTLPHNVDIKFIDIPTTPSASQPSLQTPSPAATTFRLKNTTAIVHGRLTDANTVLELRYLSWVEKPEAGNLFSGPRNLRLQIRLSATLHPAILFTQDSASLWCYVLTTNNYLVRIRMPLNTMFITPLAGNFYSIQQLDQHIVPVTFGLVSSTQIIIACQNGSLVYLYDANNDKRDKGIYSIFRFACSDIINLHHGVLTGLTL
jgi:hypothetical protein